MYDHTTDLLIFGYDFQLTSSREHLLRRAGYCVVTTDTVDDFKTAYLQTMAKAILLCQTLSPEDCATCEAFAKGLKPEVQVLIMFNQRCKCVPGEGGVLLRSASGPVLLLETVRGLLAHCPTTNQSAAA